jgi:AraC-like DNA-binding protein
MPFSAPPGQRACYSRDLAPAVRISAMLQVPAPIRGFVKKVGCVIRNARRSGGLAPWQIQLLTKHIEAQLGSRVDIAVMAGLVRLSRSHFSRAFKASLGIPPGAYVMSRRVERVKLMMTSTADSLAQIGLACGFSDQAHLSKSFRRRVGMSPGAWRRINGPGFRCIDDPMARLIALASGQHSMPDAG